MNYSSVEKYPWLIAAVATWRHSNRGDRVPHAVLLESPAGLAAEALAAWIAAERLCDHQKARPCGACASCLLLRAGNHPDLHVVRCDDDAKQVKVDQIRDLITTLVLTSYRGGCKVAIVEDAELLNVNAANALLKTLEEPTADTHIFLVATPAHRLPATIASRCRRFRLRAPPKDDAMAWLEAQKPGVDWSGPLLLAAGAPLRALALGTEGASELHAQMCESLQDLAAERVDLTILAERWAGSQSGLRLAWLDHWIASEVERSFRSSADSVKIQALFELRDAVFEHRRLADSSMNPQLAFEALLIRGQSAFAGGGKHQRNR
jgi:DNA polymerase III subunit delta'